MKTLVLAALLLSSQLPYQQAALQNLPPISVRAQPLNEAAEADGLSLQTLISDTATQLRKAGIRLKPSNTKEGFPCLYIRVELAKYQDAYNYSVRVEVQKTVDLDWDIRDHVERKAIAVIWARSGFGRVSETELNTEIRTNTASMVAAFTKEYIAANPQQAPPPLRRN